ncbi:MAG: hypothetical protein LBD40_01070 [Puniceicoccales bacterium]|jgi:methionyl-tRNA formyltransferase|nr:hypothetical protein [Puniceicoccales bacterium]
MTYTVPSIVFAGSHAIALPLLNFLSQGHTQGDHFRLSGIISQPDRASGRGKIMTPTIISRWAMEHHIPLHRPEKLDEHSIDWLQEHSCDLLLVMAYGHMIGKTIREFPKLGIFNFHTSLLPRFRGATPIEAALASDVEKTGVTLMEIVQKMDAGDILGSISVPIAFHDTQVELTDKLSHATCYLCEKFLPQLLSGNITRAPQPNEGITFCRKLETQDRLLDFHAPAEVLHRRIRALTPRPGCILELDHQPLKIIATDIDEHVLHDEKPGTLIAMPYHNAAIVAGDGKRLLLKEVQAPGGKRMPMTSFLLGHSLPWGTILPSHPMKPLEHTSFPF